MSEQRLVDVGGYRLAARISDGGSPPVVFVAGMGSGRDTWDGLGPVAPGCLQVTYDRGGIGGSDARPEREGTFGLLATELTRLLDALSVTEPAVFVGQSLGSLVIRMLADTHPDRVAGAVHVDGSVAHLILLSVGVDSSVDGDRADSTAITPIPATQEVLLASWPRCPAVVLVETPGRFQAPGPSVHGQWQLAQRQFARDIDASLVIAKESGHGIHQDQPGLVRFAIDAVVAAVRAGQPTLRLDPAETDRAGGILVY